MKGQFSFTKIDHRVRKLYGLSMNEYAVIDLVYHLSSNPASAYPGWCYASKEYMAESLDISRMSIHSILKKAVDLGLVEKHGEVKNLLRSTTKWYENAYFLQEDDGKENLQGVKNLYTNVSRNFTRDSKESLHNIKRDKEKDINIGKAQIVDNFEVENPAPQTVASDNIHPSSMAELGSLLRAKMREAESKRQTVTPRINSEKQFNGLNAVEALNLPKSYSGRIIKSVEGKPLHIVQKAIQGALSVPDPTGRAKYFFKVVNKGL